MPGAVRGKEISNVSPPANQRSSDVWIIAAYERILGDPVLRSAQGIDYKIDYRAIIKRSVLQYRLDDEPV